MSEAATEATGFEAKLEALAAQGFHLVVSEADKFVIEKTHLDGTLRFEAKSLEEVIADVEAKLAAFPGVFGHSVSRSDGTHESIDHLATQAGRPAAEEGQSGVTPSAPVEKVDIAALAPAEPAVDTSGVVAEQPGEVVTGQVGTEADAPEAPAAPLPEGAVES